MRIPSSETEQTPIRAPGVVLVCTPAGGSYGLRYELQRAPDVAGAPGAWAPWQLITIESETGQTVVDFAATVGQLTWYRARITGVGMDPGEWSSAVRAASRFLPPLEQLPETIYPLQRDRPMADGDYVGRSITPNGTTLPSGAVQDDGVGNRSILKGFQSGQCRDGDAVVFDPPFATPPNVVITGGIAYEPRSAKWGGGTFDAAEPQYDLVDALNLSASGFTASAKLRQPVASVSRSHSFSATLFAPGDSATITLANAPAFDDTYVVTWDVHYENNTLREKLGTFRVAIDVSADAGVAWTERGSGLFTMLIPSLDSGVASFAESVVATGLDPTDRVRLRVTDRDGTGLLLSAVCQAVSYFTAPTVRVASKTPDSNDRCQWAAYAKE